MKKDKSPVYDGLPIEFYQQFWTYIKDHLLTIITLMFKKEDRHRLQNYRPISLSNVDYKIFAFVLANLLHQILDKIIPKEQTAYVKSRFKGENIRQMEDIIDYTSRMNVPGYILFLDFQKII